MLGVADNSTSKTNPISQEQTAETVQSTSPITSDPWDRLMNAGSSFDTFMLLLGPIIITLGISSMVWIMTRKRRQLHNQEIDAAMELPMNNETPSQ